MHPSLFDPSTEYEALLDLTVGELRARLSVPAGGLALAPRGLHAYAPRPRDGSAAVGHAS
jgi:hypothetical protein